VDDGVRRRLLSLLREHRPARARATQAAVRRELVRVSVRARARVRVRVRFWVWVRVRVRVID